MGFDLFSPFGLATTALSVSGTTANAALSIPSATGSGSQASNLSGVSVRVYNSATVTAFIKFGTSATTAATTDMPIPAGAVETFQISPAITYIAGITAGTSGTVYATTGMGA